MANQKRTEDYEYVQASIQRLYKTCVEDGLDPDIFMESCLFIALQYQAEFTDRETLRSLVDSVLNLLAKDAIVMKEASMHDVTEKDDDIIIH